MTAWPRPSEQNDYLAPHIGLLLRSFVHWTGRPLLDWNLIDERNSYCGQAAFYKDWTFLE